MFIVIKKITKLAATALALFAMIAFVAAVESFSWFYVIDIVLCIININLCCKIYFLVKAEEIEFKATSPKIQKCTLGGKNEY